MTENIDIEISEPVPNPWDDAPTGVWFYDIQYEDGRLGNMTQSAERAYKRGWDLSNNIPISLCPTINCQICNQLKLN